jgi:hypothetical protein
MVGQDELRTVTAAAIEQTRRVIRQAARRHATTWLHSFRRNPHRPRLVCSVPVAAALLGGWLVEWHGYRDGVGEPVRVVGLTSCGMVMRLPGCLATAVTTQPPIATGTYNAT